MTRFVLDSGVVNDYIMLAAVAFALGNEFVVTTDSDLFAVPKLKVEYWKESE